ncbi:MAG: hypothetical protein AB1696_21200 [Planctomycetota bacterium]
MGSKIIFNGQEYSSVDDMPADVRRAYERVMGMFADRDGDGVPDSVQQSDGAFTADVVTKIVVNGREYNSLDEMPNDVRRMYEMAMSARRDGRSGSTFVVKCGENKIVATGGISWRTGGAQKLPRIMRGTIDEPPQDPRLALAAIVIAALLIAIAVLLVLLVSR